MGLRSAHTFSGFSDETVQFLRGLEIDNSRTFFHSNRDCYDTKLMPETRLFVDAVTIQLQRRVSAQIVGIPKVGKSMFRTHRDVRFSNDKTPYHPMIKLIWWQGEEPPRSNPMFYFVLEPDELNVGAGIMPNQDSLRRLRKTLSNDRAAAECRSIVRQIEAQHDHVEVAQPTRKRVPNGYSTDDPNEDLLRLDQLFASIYFEHPNCLGENSFVEWIVDRMLTVAPLHGWLVANRV